MVTEKSIDLLVEYDGTGAPTGNCWIDGVKHTGVTETTVGRIPPTDGKSSTKITLFQNAVIDASVPTPTIIAFKISKHGDKGAATAVTKA